MRALAMLPVALLLAASAASAQRSLVIENFHDEIHVRENGDLDVTEDIRVRFRGEWNGIRRHIPVRYETPQRLGKRMFFEIVSVTNQDGTPLEVEKEYGGGNLRLRIWVPGAANATHTVRLAYRVRNALLFFDDHDELYWNVTGTEWEMEIEAVSARVRLPREATGIRATSYVGAFGATAPGTEPEIDGNSILYAVDRPLRMAEGLTIVAGWAPGAVAQPNLVARAGWFARANWPFVIALFVFALMFRLWYTRGRDPRLRPIAAAYEPPDQMTPAELGALVDMRVDMRDVTATIVDLAVRGYIRIEELEKKSFLGLVGDTEYAFHRLRRDAEARALTPHEQRVIRELFDCGNGERVESDDLENEFYRKLHAIREELFGELVKRGYYRNRPDKQRNAWTIMGALIVAFAIPLGGALGGALGMGIAPAVAGVLSGLSVLFFGYHMPARTHHGTHALERVLGFEEFLRRVESDRFERVVKTPEMFERFLPYAMALGVESRWARAFESIYTTPPNWYVGSGWDHFSARGFTSSLSRMGTQTATVMASSPRSSGSSGFGGGGSSGGGGGGGGGGGF